MQPPTYNYGPPPPYGQQQGPPQGPQSHGNGGAPPGQAPSSFPGYQPYAGGYQQQQMGVQQQMPHVSSFPGPGPMQAPPAGMYSPQAPPPFVPSSTAPQVQQHQQYAMPPYQPPPPSTGAPQARVRGLQMRGQPARHAAIRC